MRRLSLLVLTLAIGSLVCASADARPRHLRHVARAHEITVVKRSFLDPGPVVPVGTENRYVAEANRYNGEAPAGAHNEFLQLVQIPGPFDVPGFQRR